MKCLALFDLDGTLTHSDTFLEFLKFAHGETGFYLGLIRISPFLVPYKLGVYPNWKAKEKALTYFLGGMQHSKVKELGCEFCNSILPNLIRPKAKDRLEYHRKSGHEIMIVTASCEEWVLPWANEENINALCTRMLVENGIVTGRIRGLNNYGPEKSRRIKEYIDIEQFEQIHAYGDSRGDREMLKLATHPHFRPF